MLTSDISIFDRQPGQLGAIITQLAFCPTQNVLSWTDDQGLFSRWQQPIPDTLPSPVKVTLSGTSTISVKKRSAELSLFGDDTDLAAVHDIAMDDVDDDWIIDDIGGQLGAEDAEGKNNGEAIKEMGMTNIFAIDQRLVIDFTCAWDDQ